MSKRPRQALHSKPARARDVPRRDAPAFAPTALRRGELWISYVIIVLLGVAVYWNSFGLPMVFDDRPAIERNQTIRDLSLPFQVLSPPRNTPVAGRPLVNLSFAVNYAI